MKLTLFVLCIFTLSVSATVYSQETKITMKLKNKTVQDVLFEIEDQTEFRFVFQNEEIDVKRNVSLDVKNKTVETILDQLFEGEDVNYTITSKHLIIVSPGESSKVTRSSVQQVRAISGNVVDKSGQPLPGVSIIIKGTTNGTITDVDGKFSLLSVPEDVTLVFSFIGMKTKEIIVTGQIDFNITMEEDAIGIEEVIAIGYGTMKKSDITGSVSSVPMEHLKNQPVRSLADMLSGRVAGMTLTRTSGDMGSPSKIRVRGPNSISGSNEPLTVVDGIIGGSYGSVHDIESIEILKDASSTAIYGERASNGVILITTKRATSDEPKIRVSLNTGISFRDTEYPDLMNAAEYAGFINDLRGAGTFSAQEIENFRQNGGTNWADVVSQTGLKNDHNISYSQKIDKLSVYLSGRYSDEEGTMINTSKGGDYYVRSNVDFQPNDRLKINFDLKANKLKKKNGGLSTRTSKGDPLMQALIWSPTEPIWLDEENGIYNNIDHHGALGDSPFMFASEQDNFIISSAVYSTLNVKYEIIDGLTYDVTGFAAKSTSQLGFYENEWLEPDNSYGRRDANDSFSWRFINNITYSRTFNDAHNVTLTGVYEAEAGESWSLRGYGRKMPLPDVSSYYKINLSNEQSAESGFGEASRVAYLGRLNYNYKSRYYFTASYRVDGKSGPEGRIEENKFGGFPSMAVSWRASEESFMKENGVFDNLKLRFGWGITGNPSDFAFTKMASKNFDYGIGGMVLGYIPGTPANQTIRWEETEQLDIGLDLTVLNGRLSLTVDYFDKNTTDLLTKLELPSYLGYGYEASYDQNLGEINNKGFDATIDFKPVQRQSFYWNVNLNFSTVKNEVVNLGVQGAFLTGTNANGLMSVDTYRVQEGLPLGTMWGYKWLGIWGESEAAEAAKYGELPGDNKYLDVNGDGAINLEEDAMAIGDANPDFIWGLNNSISYKNFDLSILIQGMHGQDVFNLVRATASTVHNDARSITLKDPATNYWTPQNPDSEWPNIHSVSNNKRLNSTRWIEDASWVKLKYVGLTYNVPEKFTKVGTLAVSLSAEELLTITDYKGFDPEVSASAGSDLWGGFDMGTQPIPSTVTLGVSLEF